MARKRRRLAMLALAAMAAVWLASAAHPAGRPACLVSNERTGVGTRTLQDAVDAAAAGDTLVVKGTCVGSTLITVGDLTLRGVGNPAFGVTTLDGGGSSESVVRTGQFFSLAIENLVIRGSSGPGVSMEDGRLTLSQSTITQNGSAGVSLLGGGATITDSAVTHNGSGIGTAFGFSSLVRSTISDNAGPGVFLFDSGLRASEATVTRNADGGIRGLVANVEIRDSSITNNSASGGIHIDGPGASLTATDTLVADNSSEGDGGGISTGSVFIVSGTLTRVTVRGNTAAGDGGGIFAGGDPFFAPGTSLVDSVVSGNAATRGGGLYNAGELTITGTSLLENTASAAGGAIYNDGAATLAMGTSTISGNTATQGGGIFNAGGLVTLTGGNSFSSNVPDDCVGVSGC